MFLQGDSKMTQGNFMDEEDECFKKILMLQASYVKRELQETETFLYKTDSYLAALQAKLIYLCRLGPCVR